MAQSPFKTREFKELFQHWNQRLEESGHEDIEDFSLPDAPLKSWHNLRFRKQAERIKEAQSYFELAHEATLTLEFEKDAHRKIWELHCEGLSIREIAKLLGARKRERTGLNKSMIHAILVSLQIQAGLRR